MVAIGIEDGTGSGKTIVPYRIIEQFVRRNVTYLKHDPYDKC